MTFLSTAELSARWGGNITVRTLNNWRSAKPAKGPAFVKLGGRVVYKLSDVEAWERANGVANDNQPREK